MFCLGGTERQGQHPGSQLVMCTKQPELGMGTLWLNLGETDRTRKCCFLRVKSLRLCPCVSVSHRGLPLLLPANFSPSIHPFSPKQTAPGLWPRGSQASRDWPLLSPASVSDSISCTAALFLLSLFFNNTRLSSGLLGVSGLLISMLGGTFLPHFERCFKY